MDLETSIQLQYAHAAFLFRICANSRANKLYYTSQEAFSPPASRVHLVPGERRSGVQILFQVTNLTLLTRRQKRRRSCITLEQ